MAAAYAANGEFTKAVQAQTKALELAGGSSSKGMHDRLRLYKAGKCTLNR